MGFFVLSFINFFLLDILMMKKKENNYYSEFGDEKNKWNNTGNFSDLYYIKEIIKRFIIFFINYLYFFFFFFLERERE